MTTKPAVTVICNDIAQPPEADFGHAIDFLVKRMNSLDYQIDHLSCDVLPDADDQEAIAVKIKQREAEYASVVAALRHLGWTPSNPLFSF